MSDPEMSFDPEWLQKAANELAQLKTLLDNNLAFSHLQDSSTIKGDLTSLNKENDSAGGWSWLETHISDVCKYISKVTGDIKTESGTLQQKMQSSIDALKGADDDNKSNLTNTGGN